MITHYKIETEEEIPADMIEAQLGEFDITCRVTKVILPPTQETKPKPEAEASPKKDTKPTRIDDVTPSGLLNKIQSLKQVKRRQDVLAEYGGEYVLKSILFAGFSDSVDFKLPPGTPPHTKNKDLRPLGKAEINSLAKILNFKGHAIEREQMFVRVCSLLTDADTKVAVAMKDKTISEVWPSITRTSVAKAIPELLT